MFSRLSHSSLIELCRALRHYLGAGLTLEEVFRGQVTRGSAALRPIAARISLVLKHGYSLESALEAERRHFPPLFIAMVRVGERTGMLPEVFGDLERYFLKQQELRRKFLISSAWPLIQFFLAVGVLALLIFIFGLLPSSSGANMPGGKPWDPVGLGLFGASGAGIFIGIVVGTLLGVWLFFWLLGKLLPGTFRDRFLLAVPVIGPCLRDLALMRFCLALRLTTESGMSIGKAIRLSLESTGNAAFADSSPAAERTVAEGDDLTLALTRTHLMPDDFLRIIQVAEESGQLSEVLRHQGDHYHESAGRRMTAVTFLLSVLIWLLVGTFIITFIFRIFMSYMDLLDSVSKGV